MFLALQGQYKLCLTEISRIHPNKKVCFGRSKIFEFYHVISGAHKIILGH